MPLTDPWSGEDDTDYDYYDTPSGNIWRPGADPGQPAGDQPGRPARSPAAHHRPHPAPHPAAPSRPGHRRERRGEGRGHRAGRGPRPQAGLVMAARLEAPQAGARPVTATAPACRAASPSPVPAGSCRPR
jgi:hypothetical protein